MTALSTLTRTEYARLFIGPREVVAPLHESAWRSGTARMFTAETLAVRPEAVRMDKLAPGDIVCWAGNLSNSDQLILFSERGYAKRLMGSMSDAQGRGGKGVHAFYFNKSGSNGSYVAAFARLSEPRSFSVLQKQGELTPLTAAEIAPQDLTDRGKPYVLALLDNVVTDIVL